MKLKIFIAASVLLASLGTLNLNAADAKAHWKEHCAKCHGDDGKGNTKMGRKLKVEDYTDAAVQAKMKDDAMAKAIKEGVKEDGKTRMKGFEDKLKPEEIKALVEFIRKFKK